jgi:hypothetical protein
MSYLGYSELGIPLFGTETGSGSSQRDFSDLPVIPWTGFLSSELVWLTRLQVMTRLIVTLCRPSGDERIVSRFDGTSNADFRTTQVVSRRTVSDLRPAVGHLVQRNENVADGDDR